MKPTSLPWRVVTRSEQGTSNGRRITLDAQSGIVADLDWNTPKENEANAALIVQAVNSHAALVAACKVALTVLEDSRIALVEFEKLNQEFMSGHIKLRPEYSECEVTSHQTQVSIRQISHALREALRLAGDK